MNGKTEVKTVKFLSKDAVSRPGCVIFTLGNGQTVTADLGDYNEKIVTDLTLHGLSQKIGDSAAGCAKDKAYGAAFSAMTAVNDALKAGKWGADREGTGGQLVADLIQAIALLKRMDVEAVGAAVRVADDATIKAWLKNAKITATILELKSKRAKAAAKDSEEDFEFTV